MGDARTRNLLKSSKVSCPQRRCIDVKLADAADSADTLIKDKNRQQKWLYFSTSTFLLQFQGRHIYSATTAFRALCEGWKISLDIKTWTRDLRQREPARNLAERQIFTVYRGRVAYRELAAVASHQCLK